jgi:linoleate 10R-lipoxygenase
MTALHTVFGENANPDDITTDDFKAAARKLLNTRSDHTAWTFGGLKRQGDGTFRDEDLANILQNA